MTLVATYDGDVLDNVIRLRAGGDNGIAGLNASADGSPSFGAVLIEDTDALLDIVGWRPFIVEETACAKPRLFTGYVADRTVSRGAHYRTDGDRAWDSTIVDQNAIFHMRLITGADGKRPAETHIQRIDWLLGSPYLGGLIDDYGLVDRSNPRPFGAADYRGQYPDDVLADIAAPIFRIFFAYWDEDEDAIGLFFDTPDSTTSDSTLQISNVLADVDGVTTFEPYIDAQLVRDPSEIYATVRYVWSKGVVLRHMPSTATTFIQRGLNVENTRIGSAASAEEMADNLLTRDSQENDTITVTVRLPNDKVGLVDAGQRIRVKFSHLPDYDDWSWLRITQRTTLHVEGRRDLYEVSLTLNGHGLPGGGGGGAPGQGELPAPSTGAEGECEPGHDYTLADTFGALGSAISDSRGNIMYWRPGVSAQSYPTPAHAGDWHFPIFGGGVDYAGDCALNAVRFAVVGPGTATVQTTTYTAPRNLVAALFRSDTDTQVGASVFGPTGTIFTFTVPDDGVCGHYIDVSDVGDICGGKWGFVQATWTPVAGEAPRPGQTVTSEFVAYGNGTTTTFTTHFPFADASLRVLVDRLDQTAAVTSYDGATGSFTLGFAPKAGERVEVSYQGR